MRPTVYIETSVLSYLAARPSRDIVIAGYQQVTREWWASARDRFKPVASEFVASEAGEGDADAARARLELLQSITLLRATEDTQELTRKLLDLGAVPRQAADDAAHIAIAVTHGGGLSGTCDHLPRPTNSWTPTMQKPTTDPIVAEIRAVREEHAARFGYDVQAIFDDIRAREKASGRTYVQYPARRVAVDAEDRAGSAQANRIER